MSESSRVESSRVESSRVESSRVSQPDRRAFVLVAINIVSAADHIYLPLPLPLSLHLGKMHNGGGMSFGPDGYLYLATGDTGYPKRIDPTYNFMGKNSAYQR